MLKTKNLDSSLGFWRVYFQSRISLMKNNATYRHSVAIGLHITTKRRIHGRGFKENPGEHPKECRIGFGALPG
jgi:hypothetical protein